ncbi:MAG: CpaF family protein, partial [bacterium]
MSLRDKFRTGTTVDPSTAAPKSAADSAGPRAPAPPPKARALPTGYHDLKARIHRTMVQRLNLASLEAIEADALLNQIRRIVSELLENETTPLTEVQRAALEQEILNETFGLGPIEPLLHDPDVSDILVNTCTMVYVEKFGRLERTDVRFDDNAHLMKFIDRIVSRVGRRVDESSPMVDARLPDGSRVNAIIPPLALDGPILSIRRFGVRTLTMEDLVARTSISPGMASIVNAAVRARLNILVAGGTGSGKTTLLNALSASIPET